MKLAVTRGKAIFQHNIWLGGFVCAGRTKVYLWAGAVPKSVPECGIIIFEWLRPG